MALFAQLRRIQRQLAAQAEVKFEYKVENSGLTAKQIDHGYRVLKALSLSNKQQALVRDDMMTFLYTVGLNPTIDLLETKLRQMHLHHHKTFTYGQLCHIWKSITSDMADEEEILKRAFQFFDKDGNGDISVQELITTMHELGDLLTEKEILEFVNIMDVNNDGSISYEEFIATLKTQTGADGPALPPGKEGEGKEAAATTFESPLKRTKSIDHRKAAKARSNTMERSREAGEEQLRAEGGSSGAGQSIRAPSALEQDPDEVAASAQGRHHSSNKVVPL